VQVVEFPGRYPPQRVVIGVQDRFVRRSNGKQYEPDPSVGRLTEPPSGLGPEAEFLVEFPDESRPFRLTRFDLATRKLPAAGEVGGTAAARGQHPAVPDERRRHDKGHSGMVPGTKSPRAATRRSTCPLWWDRPMFLATTDEANELLGTEPLAVLIGMLLDQQIPMEKAFTSPAVLKERLGGALDARTIAEYDADAFEEIFRRPPALHRFPAAMGKRVQALARVLVDEYGGRAENVWSGVADGGELVRRVQTLPGFGAQKAKIFTALLGKQFDVRPPGWREAAGDYGTEGSLRSVADVVDDASLKRVRAFKQQMKAAAKADAS
jgi:uncharacterized HhH-GPD family protein